MKKSTIRKIAALILCALLVSLSLLSCGRKDENQSAAGTSETAGASTAPQTAGKASGGEASGSVSGIEPAQTTKSDPTTPALTTPASTEPAPTTEPVPTTEPAPTVEPTLTEVTTTGEPTTGEPTPTQPAGRLLKGRLLENRKFTGGYLPVAEGSSFSSRLYPMLVPDGDSPASYNFKIYQMDFSFWEFYRLYDNEKFEGEPEERIYGSGKALMIGSSDSVTVDKDGRIRALILNKDLVSEFQLDFSNRELMESLLVTVAVDFVGQFSDYDLSSLPYRYQTEYYDGALGETVIEEGLNYKTDGGATYSIVFAGFTGELQNDCGVVISYHDRGMPLPTLNAEFFYGMDQSASYPAYAELKKDDVLYTIKELLPGIIEGCRTVTGVYFYEDTLRFTLHNGQPAATVDAVVDMIDGSQIVTGLCLVFEE